MNKTIWITRLSAFQLQCGGLSRVQVWLKCLVYIKPEYFEEIQNPFGSEREIGRYSPKGWGVNGGNFQTSIPFDQLFGYDNKISKEVWTKLKEYFGNSDFREWESYEKENEECSIKNFMLKINLEIKYNHEKI